MKFILTLHVLKAKLKKMLKKFKSGEIQLTTVNTDLASKAAAVKAAAPQAKAEEKTCR